MSRFLMMLFFAFLFTIGSGALAEDTRRTLQRQNTAQGDLQGRLVNQTNAQNQYTGNGSCNCTGGGIQTYSGCGNAGMNIWNDGVYDPTGRQIAQSCADAACAAAGAGSCSLATLAPEEAFGYAADDADESGLSENP